MVGEERLSKRPRVRERRDFAEWMEGLQKRQYPYAEGCSLFLRFPLALPAID